MNIKVLTIDGTKGKDLKVSDNFEYISTIIRDLQNSEIIGDE